jgi:hypothetical protein
MKIAVFWDVAPCSLVDTDGRFRGAYCLHHQSDDRLDDGGSNLIRCNIPEDSHLHTHRRENLKYHLKV